MKIAGTIALVTGAGSPRLGRQFACHLAKQGAKIAVHYRSSDAEASETVAMIEEAGGVATMFRADLSVPQQVIELAQQVRQKYGYYNLLVNSASLFQKMELHETTLDAWDVHTAINLRAPFLLAQEMMKSLPEGVQGKVINIGDWHTATPSRFPYGVTKAGLKGLTRSLAVSMAPNVQVNQVSLGAILSPADGGVATDESDAFHGRNAKAIANSRLCKRMGTPEEVAQTISALIENDYITGQDIRIAGGVDVW